MKKLIDRLMDWLVPERKQCRLLEGRLEYTMHQLVRAVNLMGPRQRKKYFLALARVGLTTFDLHGFDVPHLDLRIK